MLTKLLGTQISLKMFSSLQTQAVRPVVSERIPDGCLFAPLRRGTQAAYSHPLDDVEGHLKFLREELPSEFDDFPPTVLGYDHRMKELLNHSVPSVHTCWTFGCELLSKFMVPKKLQSEEHLKKVRLLRACVELRMAGTTTVDDIIDLSDMRMGKPTWRKVCPEGASVAMYDGILLNLLPYHIIKKHFRNSPGYHMMLEAFQRVHTESVMGLSLEVMGHRRPHLVSREDFLQTVLYLKTGCFFGYQPTLGILLAGILDEKLIAKVEQIFYKTGIMIQAWDDFCDYYCTSGQTGKPSNDFQNAAPSWATITAMELFSDEQKRLFKESYGSTDLDKVDIVRRLYDSVHLPTEYANYMKSEAQHCARLIANVDHEECRNACTSWLNWLVGDFQGN